MSCVAAVTDRRYSGNEEVVMIVRNGKENEGGYVLVTVAAMLVILVSFTALAIDTGILFGNRTQSQRAADAAALAGAFTFVADSESSQPATAEAHARATAVKNTVMGVSIDPSQVDVCVGAGSPGACTTDPSLKRVKVTITRQEPTFFAKIWGAGWMNVTTRVEAIAEASAAPTSAKCLKPFFIPNTALPPDPLITDTCTRCGSGNVLVDGTTNPPSKTAFAQGLIDNNTTFILKPQDPHDALSPSQFYMIDIPSNDGIDGKPGYKDNIVTCLNQATVCRGSYNVLTGNTSGPTRAGINLLIGDPPRDTFVDVGQYRYPDSTIHDTSKALVIAPIWNPCATTIPGTPPTPLCPGGQFPSGGGTNVPPISIIGFAMLFVDSVDNQEGVHAHLIDVLACGADISDPDGSSAFSVPLRLIRPPD
jgi:uncharacterized membrane protein